MGKAITTTGQPGGLTVPKAQLPAELAEAVRDYAEAAHAENTSKAYRKAWARFEGWCASHSQPALPASPATVAAWIAAAGRGIAGSKSLSRSSINQVLSAVVLKHRTEGHILDRKAPEIAAMWRGMSRTKAKAGGRRAAAPIMGDDLRQLCQGLGKGRPADVRDAALLVLGWAAALRRTELVGLDWRKLGTGCGYVSIEERGIVVRLPTSKGSQTDEIRINIPWDDMPTACDALACWSNVANLKDGDPVFRRINNTGGIGAEHLTDGSVSRIVKARMGRFYRNKGKTPAEAEALAGAFSGHSMRAGYATTAGEKDVPGYRIKDRMRHKSMDTTAAYIRSGQQWTKSGLKGVGF